MASTSIHMAASVASEVNAALPESAAGRADRAMERLTRLAVASLNVASCVLAYGPPDNPQLNFGGAIGSGRRNGVVVPSQRFWELVASTKSAVLVEDAQADARLRDDPFILSADARGCAAIPLRSSDASSIGAFVVVDVRPRPWSAHDVALLVDLASIATTELQLLHETEQRFRAELLSRATNDVVWDWDLVRGTLHWNESLRAVFGHDPADLAKIDSWEIYLHPEDRDRVSTTLTRAIEGDALSWSDDYRYRCRDGSYVVVHDRGHISRDATGRALRMIGSMLDITERTRAEEAIRFQARLLDAVEQAVVATDMTGKILYWNAYAERLFGWRASEVIGRSVMDVVVSDQMVSRATDIMSCVARGQSWTGEFVVRHRDGRYLTIQITDSPIRGREGQLIGVVGVSQDVTERKHLEDQLRQAQKMEAVGQLAGGIAHDFNNLLTVIKVHAELLLEEIQPSNPSHGDVADIQRAAVRAASLTRQLLAFSRKQLLQPRELELNTVVADLDRMLRRLLGEHIDIVTTMPPDVGSVLADPGQLEQVLINLAVNARDAMPEGGRLTIETKSATLEGQYLADHPVVAPGRYAMLIVSDTGMGMDRDTCARIFEPFFTTKEAGRGTGLGLSTVYGIIRQSGGYVWVYSEPGLGTTFRIYLPRVDAGTGEERQRNTSAMAARARGTETVLLVEDESGVRGLARRLLTRQGYGVLEAGNGREALAVAAQYKGRIDLVVTDAVMPEMGGAELARSLAASRPETKVLYMSGYTDDEIIRRGILDPSMAFLQKPFTANDLALRVRDTLDGRRSG